MKKRQLQLKESAKSLGIRVHTYSPGDGVTRYRFFRYWSDVDSYFSGPGIYTALGIREAETFLDGFSAGLG